MALTAEQRRVLAHIKRGARRAHATPKELKSAIETGLVESNLRNLPGGDRDSVGWRQERGSLYKNPHNLDASIARYFRETRAVRGKYGNAGDLAAAVQRPAAQYRGRYQQQSGRADQLRGGSVGSAISNAAHTTSTTTTTTPGVDNSKARAATVLNFLNDKHSDVLDFATTIKSQADVPATSSSQSKTTQDPSTKRASFHTPASRSGTANFEGTQVAAWIRPALVYGRKHGWKGKVESGFRSRADQTRIYNSGVRPAARPGTSNHEGANYPRGAVDVSDAQTLSRILQRSPYGGRLKYAGAKDPVHFSHPHNGSY